MFNRRKFLELSRTAILPFVVRPLLGQLNQAHFPIGLQLSTLVKKNMAEPDLVQVLSQIRSVGFQQVEPRMPPAPFSKTIKEGHYGQQPNRSERSL